MLEKAWSSNFGKTGEKKSITKGMNSTDQCTINQWVKETSKRSRVILLEGKYGRF